MPLDFNLLTFRNGLVVLESSVLKGDFTISALCYNPKDIPASKPDQFLLTLYSDKVFNFDVA